MVPVNVNNRYYNWIQAWSRTDDSIWRQGCRQTFSWSRARELPCGGSASNTIHSFRSSTNIERLAVWLTRPEKDVRRPRLYEKTAGWPPRISGWRWRNKVLTSHYEPSEEDDPPRPCLRYEDTLVTWLRSPDTSIIWDMNRADYKDRAKKTPIINFAAVWFPLVAINVALVVGW